jgi:Spy/CpxP family protein refolding chaperone
MRRPGKICWIILALFLLGNIVLLGFWWFDDDNSERKREFSKEERQRGMRQHFIKNTDISEEQFDEMFALWKKHSMHMKSFENNIDSLRKIVISETFSDTPDSVKVKKTIVEIAKQQQQIEEANFYHYRKIRSICSTDKQRELLDKMFRSKMKDGHPKRRHRGHRNRH